MHTNLRRPHRTCPRLVFNMARVLMDKSLCRRTQTRQGTLRRRQALVHMISGQWQITKVIMIPAHDKDMDRLPEISKLGDTRTP